jgi:hypothetical protein
MVGRVPRLNEHTPPLWTSPRTTCYLGQQLKGPLGGAEVREIESGIGIDSTDQGDVWEIQPFGNHLGAYQQIHLTRLNRAQNSLMRPFSAGRVQIHPRDPRVGISFRQHSLELLGSYSAHLLDWIGTRPAGDRKRLLMAAVVASKTRRSLVHRE